MNLEGGTKLEPEVAHQVGLAEQQEGLAIDLLHHSKEEPRAAFTHTCKLLMMTTYNTGVVTRRGQCSQRGHEVGCHCTTTARTANRGGDLDAMFSFSVQPTSVGGVCGNETTETLSKDTHNWQLPMKQASV